MSASCDDLRWAARFGFVDELWRDRARIVLDPALEAVLLEDALEGDVMQGVRDLLDALLPETAADGVWMVVSNADVAAQLRHRRPGTTFVPRHGMIDLLRRADWDVALVDLGPVLGEDERELAGELGRGVEQGRAVVLSLTRSPDAGEDEPELDYGELADVLARELGGGRIYGVYAPPMAAVVDMGERIESAHLTDDLDVLDVDLDAIESDDIEWVENTGSFELPVRVDDSDGGDDVDDDVPLVYDNTLGSQAPELSAFVAVAGTELAADGLTLVELPARARASDEPDAAALASLRAQLVQARRRGDLAAIDRQAHVERIDVLEGENERLRSEVMDLRDRLARLVDASEVAADEAPGDEPDDGPDDGPDEGLDERLDAALAREQALRWRVTQLERELDALIGRPVDALQAEVASLRAQLEQLLAGTSAAAGAAVGDGAATGFARLSEDRAIDTSVLALGRPRRPNGHDPGLGANRGATQAIVRAVEKLVRRVERGGIGTLELRRHLVNLRRRLLR